MARVRQLSLFDPPDSRRGNLIRIGSVWMPRNAPTRPVERFEGPTPILIGCVSRKAAERRRAADLYLSPLFLKRRAFAERSGRPWWIFSALHGVIDPKTELDPYDVTIPGLSRRQKVRLVELVGSQLDDLAPGVEELEVHAGAPYRGILRSAGIRVVNPLAGLGIGRQLAWYSSRT